MIKLTSELGRTNEGKIMISCCHINLETKAEMFMPLISAQYSVATTNSIRLSDWP